MKETPRAKRTIAADDDLKPEYNFDYTQAKPNRFAAQAQAGSVAVLLDPDVARVFRNSGSVNSVLRALLETMPRP